MRGVTDVEARIRFQYAEKYQTDYAVVELRDDGIIIVQEGGQTVYLDRAQADFVAAAITQAIGLATTVEKIRAEAGCDGQE